MVGYDFFNDQRICTLNKLHGISFSKVKEEFNIFFFTDILWQWLLLAWLYMGMKVSRYE